MESRKILNELARGNDAFALWTQRRQENLYMPEMTVWPSSTNIFVAGDPVSKAGLDPFTQDRVKDSNIGDINTINVNGVGQYNFFDTVFDARTPVVAPIVWCFQLSELRVQNGNSTGQFFVGFANIPSVASSPLKANLNQNAIGIGTTFGTSIANTTFNLWGSSYPTTGVSSPYRGQFASQTAKICIVLYPNGNWGIKTTAGEWFWHRLPMFDSNPCRLNFSFLTTSYVSPDIFRLSKTDITLLNSIFPLHGLATVYTKGLQNTTGNDTVSITTVGSWVGKFNLSETIPTGICGWGIRVNSASVPSSDWGIVFSNQTADGSMASWSSLGLIANKKSVIIGFENNHPQNLMTGSDVVAGTENDEIYLRRDASGDVYGATKSDRIWTRIYTSSVISGTPVRVGIMAKNSATINYTVLTNIPEFK